MQNNAGDTARARKDRADAIRKARDARNAPAGPSRPGSEADAKVKPGAEPQRQANDQKPNYVDLIDRKMRKMDQEEKPDEA